MTSDPNTAVKLISADWLVDGTGRDAMAGGAVAVRGERIAAVGDAASLAARFPGAERLHFAGCAILPGLVDSHVHLTFSASAVPLADIQGDGDVTVGLRGAINARDALLAGVTTLRDLGGRDRTTLELRNAIAAGAIPGPRLLACGRPITIPDGHCHFLGGVAKGVKEVTALSNELVEEGVDVIKVMATGGNMTATSDPLKAQFSREEVAAIVGVANAARLRVTAHARGVDGIRVAAEANVHGIEHCRMEVAEGEWKFDDELARQLADKGIFAAPTLAASYRAFQRQAAGGTVGVRKGAIPFAIRQQNAALLRDAGVRVVVGTDAGAALARFDEAVHVELESLVGAGWTPLEAITAGTLGAATAIGREKEIGSLEAGKLADFVVTRGNPARHISDVRQVEEVFLGGRQVAARGQATLDARPTPWPEEQIAQRTAYRSTDVGPRLSAPRK
jgi:imidazolonepropionase-like amidohydrolase